MDWYVLGIEETKDRDAIIAAYRSKLSSVNPEDKPQEFMELRRAYEEALVYAESESDDEGEKTPLERWVDELSEIYHDFRLRNDLDAWRELLDQDICIAIDSRMDVEEAMLRFFGENYFLPQKIWKFLDEQFNFSEREDELFESYPHDFVQYVILNGIRYEEILPYDLFDPGEDASACEHYIVLYNKITNMPAEESAELRKELKELPEQHPYGQIFLLRTDIFLGEKEKIKEAKEICQFFTDDMTMLFSLGKCYEYVEDYSKALENYKTVLESDKTHYGARWGKANALAKLGSFSDAISDLEKLMEQCGGDLARLQELDEIRKEWNAKLIEEYSTKASEAALTNDDIFQLAWCYLQNEKKDEAYKWACEMKLEEGKEFQYYNLMHAVSSDIGKDEDALVYINKLIEVVAGLKPDGTEKTLERMGRMPEMLIRRAEQLMKLGRKEESMADYEAAYEKCGNNADVLSTLIRVKLHYRDYLAAERYARDFTERFPSYYHGYLLHAYALFEIRRDQEALAQLEEAISLNASDLECYLLKLQIFVRHDLFEAAHQLIDFLAENGIENEPTLNYCKALLLENEDKENRDEEKIYESYKALYEKVQEIGENLNWTADYYYRYAISLADQQAKDKAFDQNAIMDLLEKGLAFDPKHFDCLEYKGWLLKRDGNRKEALEIYHRLEAYPRYNLYIESQLAELYYSNLSFDAPSALNYYKMLAQDKEHEKSEHHFYIGMCYMTMGNLEEAEKHFKIENELDPDDVDSYIRLSEVYLFQKRFEEALEQADLLIKCAEATRKHPAQFFDHKVTVLRRMGRYTEAVDVLRYVLEKYDYKEAYDEIFDIYCSRGLWKEAKALTKERLKKAADKDEKSKAVDKLIWLSLYKGDMSSIEIDRLRLGMYLTDEQKFDQECAINRIKGREKKFRECMEKKLADKKEKGQYIFNVLIEFAKSYEREGDRENTVLFANLTLDEIEKEMRGFTFRNAPSLLGNKAMALALKGEIEEARKLIAEVLNMPICNRCPCEVCRDGLFFDAMIEYLAGEREKGVELMEKTVELWHADPEYQCYLKRMKKKTGKK